jgi:hypothetical protein
MEAGPQTSQADLSFLPDANLGIVILTNAQNANLFCAALRPRMLELAFGQPMEMDAVLSARIGASQTPISGQNARLQLLDSAAFRP